MVMGPCEMGPILHLKYDFGVVCIFRQVIEVQQEIKTLLVWIIGTWVVTYYSIQLVLF